MWEVNFLSHTNKMNKALARTFKIGALALSLTTCAGMLSYCTSCISKNIRRAQEEFDNIKPSLETIDVLGVDARSLRDLNNPNIQYIDLPPYRSLDFLIEDVNGEKVLRTNYTYKMRDNYNFHNIRQKTVIEGIVDEDDVYAD